MGRRPLGDEFRWMGSKAAKDTASFEDAVIVLIPAIRAFARSLTRSQSDVDDLVQETLARAWRYQASYEPGSNLKSWLYKILQNHFYTSSSRDRTIIQDSDGYWAARQAVPAAQEWRLQYSDILEAMQKLPPDSREALALLVEEGCSYEEAAELAHCPVGTFKSRVKRARDRLYQGM